MITGGDKDDSRNGQLKGQLKGQLSGTLGTLNYTLNVYVTIISEDIYSPGVFHQRADGHDTQGEFGGCSRVYGGDIQQPRVPGHTGGRHHEPRAYFVLVGQTGEFVGNGANGEIEHVQMDQREDGQSVPSFRMAGWLWGVQREQQSRGCRGGVHQGAGGASQEGIVPG